MMVVGEIIANSFSGIDARACERLCVAPRIPHPQLKFNVV